MARSKKFEHNKEFDTQTIFTPLQVDPEQHEPGEPNIHMYTYPDVEDFADERVPEEQAFDTRNYEPRPLDPEDEGYEDILANLDSMPTKPKYWYEEFGDCWSCSCGHINTGDVCESCGLERELLRKMFVLKKPGQEDDGYGYEGYGDINPIVPAGTEKPVDTGISIQHGAGMSTKKKLIIAILAALVLIAGGFALIYYTVILPEVERQEAAEAQAMSDALEGNIPMCVNNINDMYWDSIVDAGDDACDNGDYLDALDYYDMAGDINMNDTLQDKIYKAKYGYVKANQSKGGDTFVKFMKELMGVSYPGVKEIYDKYYAWDYMIVANSDDDDYKTDQSEFSRADVVYFHVKISGGEPGKKLKLYYEIETPNGKKQTETLDSLGDGGKTTVSFLNPVPRKAKEGTLTFNLYNADTQKLLETKKVTQVK